MKWSLTINGDEFEVKDVLEKLVKVLGDQTRLSESDSKYSPLREYLAEKRDAGETTLGLSLDEIQGIIGNELPNSAYEYDAFWRDRTRGIGMSIVQAGWQVQALERNKDNKIEKVGLQISARSTRTMREIEKEAILNALREAGGDKTKAAKQLEITPRTIRNKMVAYNLERTSSDTDEIGPSETLKEIEKETIVNALQETGGDGAKAAKLLGISLRELYYRMKQYGIER